jgi:hypothetical protein
MPAARAQRGNKHAFLNFMWAFQFYDCGYQELVASLLEAKAKHARHNVAGREFWGVNPPGFDIDQLKR